MAGAKIARLGGVGACLRRLRRPRSGYRGVYFPAWWHPGPLQEETKRTASGMEQLLERRARHLLSGAEGMFPGGKLNPDEIEVLDTEMARHDALDWYRNPTGGRDSMSIAYRDSHGDWRTLRSDFLFFSNSDQGVRASIVDPYRNWLPDAAWKSYGMARFAEVYGDHVHRIEAISRVDGKLRMLDFKLADVRVRVLDESDARFAYDKVSVAY